MNNKITIAIDGYSSCGKSTLAKELAKTLHYVFIDSGAMYRGVTLYALQNEIIHQGELNRGKLIQSLPEVQLKFELNPETKSPELLLNGVNVETEIRKPFVSARVSEIAAVKEVRQKLVHAQQLMGAHGGIVMDGRDIGSVVFPNAELKLFVTAEIDTRVERRFQELLDKGENVTRESVKENLQQRDLIDSTRAESPLIQVDDAIVIDNTNLTREEQLKLALQHVQNTLATFA